MRTLCFLGALALGTALSTSVAAQEALPVARASQIRIDGAIREWSAGHFVEVGSGNDASMRFSLAHDETNLYAAAQVRDDRMVRTAAPGADEDAVIILLAVPQGSQGTELRGIEIWLWAGESGRAARVGIGAPGERPRVASAARIVEAPSSGGYTVEAQIPWSAIPGSSRWQDGRGTVRLRDVDQSANRAVESEPSLVPFDAAHLERLPALQVAGGEAAAIDAFVRERHLTGTAPRFELEGNVGEDSRPEHVVIIDRFVVVAGPGWEEGTGYSFLQLPVAAAADVLEARLVELTGDGASELATVLRQREGSMVRDVWTVVSFEAGVRVDLAIEKRIEIGGGHVEANIVVGAGRQGQPPMIRVSAGQAHQLDASHLAPTREADDAETLPLPWGPVRSRTYQWSGHQFATASQEANPSYVPPGNASGSGAGQSGGGTAPPTQPPPQTQPGMDQLLAAFRQQRGIPERQPPTFRMQANVAAGAEPEELVVYGRDLVVVGPAYRNGTGWFHFELPAREPADVLEVRTAELTGDARHEVMVRARQTVGDVRREILYVFQFTVAGFPNILLREVMREQGNNRVQNEVRTSPGALEIRPGTARGWDAQSWRFPDGPGPDGVVPPLLPWRDQPVTFRFSSGRLVPR